jgi:hypothetical protein
MANVDYVSYAALILLLAAFAMRTVTRLRMVAIAAGVVFILHAYATRNWPVAIGHFVILLVNFYRVNEMRRLVASAKAAGGSPFTVDWLLPYMRPVDIPAGHVLFSRGDRADALYFISAGTVVFDEMGLEIGKGTIFGEIGVFSADRRRTATARCVEPCSLLVISADKVRELYYQNPEFGFFLVGLITDRMMDNARKLQEHTAAGAIV